MQYITGPYKKGTGDKTIGFAYHLEAEKLGLTKHYDPSDPQKSGSETSENETTSCLEDINGDGLVDELLLGEGCRISKLEHQ